MYDNIMIQRRDDKPLKANDLEMMFKAYKGSLGEPWNNIQFYKTFEKIKEDPARTISDCIKRTTDEYDEEGKEDNDR